MLDLLHSLKDTELELQAESSFREMWSQLWRVTVPPSEITNHFAGFGAHNGTRLCCTYSLHRTS